MSRAIIAVVLALAFAACITAEARLRKKSTGLMQPDVVAHTLAQVEDEWQAQASAFAECNAGASSDADLEACQRAPEAFKKSCTMVVNSVVEASNGERSVVKEYLADVCQQKGLVGWKKDRCQSLATAVIGAMSADNFDNREKLDGPGLCHSFFSKFSDEEKARVEQEKKDAEEREKKEAEELAEAEKKAAVARAEAEKKASSERAEAEKKAAAERAVAEKKAAEAKAVAEKKAAEEETRRQKQEAEERAAAAQKKADEAVAMLAAKKAEAEKVAQEAKEKMEQAKAAEEEVKQHQAAAEQAKKAAKTVEIPTPEKAETKAPATVEAAKPPAAAQKK